uniref:NAD-dependent epimerase/dehydratase domain-containing protein n=1 Tax=Moniliophthora roreri TaxID=221103 RepID=A0A0W0FGB6_MONRR
MASKVVICGAGFLGSHIAQALGTSTAIKHCVQLASRNPVKTYSILEHRLPADRLLSPATVDITKPLTLTSTFQNAAVVVSLVGIMHGTPQDFENIQWKGAFNVAEAAQRAGAKVVHISAIGADANSEVPYTRTKALGEQAVLEHCPDATIIRPSIVFGPEDDFFNRFSRLSKYLPFMPVFGGGTSRFQPVYVDDIARAVEIIARNDPKVNSLVSGKIIEAGGPDVLTYRQIMELVLKYNGRWRPIISLPFWLGMIQASILERLPHNLFTLTRSQVSQLKMDNVVNEKMSSDTIPISSLLEMDGQGPLKSVDEILPTYLSK